MKSAQMPNLIVIVDPDYGDRLERAARAAPAWVVASQTNRKSCERLSKNYPCPDHREIGAVTSYETPNPEDRMGSLLNIIPVLETHHGELNGDELTFPKAFVLEVIGLALADNVTNALGNLGFSSFVETPEGFRAHNGCSPLTS